MSNLFIRKKDYLILCKLLHVSIWDHLIFCSICSSSPPFYSSLLIYLPLFSSVLFSLTPPLSSPVSCLFHSLLSLFPTLPHSPSFAPSCFSFPVFVLHSIDLLYEYSHFRLSLAHYLGLFLSLPPPSTPQMSGQATSLGQPGAAWGSQEEHRDMIM